MSATSDIRAKFEAYILIDRGHAYLARTPGGEDWHGIDYADHFVQEAWEAWKERYATFNRNPAPLIQPLVVAAQKADKTLWTIHRDLKNSTIYGELAISALQAHEQLRSIFESEMGVICGVCGKLHEHDAPNCLDKTVRPLGY